MRTIRFTCLLVVLSVLFAVPARSIAWAQDGVPPTTGEITLRDVVDCFDEGLQEDGTPVYCEVSAVVFDGNDVVLASDKPIPGDGRSPVFSFPYPGSGSIAGSRTYLTAAALVNAIKYEDMTLTPDGQYVIASTGFDRVQDGSSEWDGYNTLLAWPVGDPDAVQVVSASTNDGVTSSVGLRDQISRALATPVLADGAPYFKVEGIAAIPGDRLLFGIREVGVKYDDFGYAVKIIAVSYRIVDGTLSLGDDFELIYDFDPGEQSKISQTVGLSSIEYDTYHDRLYLLTSFETGETDEGLGGYLWTLPLDGLNDGQPATLVTKASGDPLLFAHKSEGITVLSANLLLVVHDDDRVLGRDTVEDPDTQFSRGAHQSAYALVSLDSPTPALVPAPLPETGGVAYPVYAWLILLGVTLIVVGARHCA